MSEATETTTQATEADEKDPAWYREEIKRRDAKISTLTKQAFKSAYKEAGIDTSKGLGAKIAEHFDGDPDVEQIREFAKGYEYPLPESAAEAKVESVHTTTESIEETVTESIPVEAGDLTQRIAQAQADEQWDVAAELEMQRAHSQ